MKKYILLLILLIVVSGGIIAVIKVQKKNPTDLSTVNPDSNQPVNLKQNEVNNTGGFGKTITNDISEPKLVPQNEITLQILSPADKSTVTNPALKVSGLTIPNADVFVNEIETKADSTGKFSATIMLEEDDNYLVVVANDENGNTGEAELTVTYQAPQE
jgi:hypothetical protein